MLINNITMQFLPDILFYNIFYSTYFFLFLMGLLTAKIKIIVPKGKREEKQKRRKKQQRMSYGKNPPQRGIKHTIQRLYTQSIAKATRLLTSSTIYIATMNLEYFLRKQKDVLYERRVSIIYVQCATKVKIISGDYASFTFPLISTDEV